MDSSRFVPPSGDVGDRRNQDVVIERADLELGDGTEEGCLCRPFWRYMWFPRAPPGVVLSAPGIRLEKQQVWPRPFSPFPTSHSKHVKGKGLELSALLKIFF